MIKPDDICKRLRRFFKGRLKWLACALRQTDLSRGVVESISDDNVINVILALLIRHESDRKIELIQRIGYDHGIRCYNGSWSGYRYSIFVLSRCGRVAVSGIIIAR